MISEEELDEAICSIMKDSNDLESAKTIFEAVAIDGYYIIAGRVNIVRVAMKCILEYLNEPRNLNITETRRENVKLRVELEQEKEKCKKLSEFIAVTGGKDIEDITATKYMKIKQEGYLEGRQYEQQNAEEIIRQEIKNIEKRMETATNSIEYQKLHCAQEYLRGLLWEV